MDIQVYAPNAMIPFPRVEVKLSEKNIRALLAGLDKGSENNNVVRFIEGVNTILILTGETNEEHYTDREAGQMAEDIELAIARQEIEERFGMPDLDIQSEG